MTYEQMAAVLDRMHQEEREVRAAGQSEYAHKEENSFANFERVAERLGLTREQVLLVYLEKHLDGIHSYVQGHRSQREDVSGRIKDARMYLALLQGMIDQERGAERPKTPFGDGVLYI
jgi:hypothetical protein